MSESEPIQPDPGERVHEYNLLLPFLPVESKGGPYDDLAFCAGYDVGYLHAQMRLGEEGVITTQVRSALVEQLDLCAMESDWHMQNNGEEDDWTSVVLLRGRK